MVAGDIILTRDRSKLLRGHPSSRSMQWSKMNVYTQRILSKLPRDIIVLELPHFRSLHKVSWPDNADRARVLVATAHCKNFQFRYDNVAPFRAVCTMPVHDLSHIGRGNMLVLCKRNYASEKKSLVEARESPYAHLTPAQKGM